MKKLLLILLVAGTIFSGCKKDTAKSSVTLSQADIAAVNTQLKGSWVFPIKTLTVVDSSGKALLPGQNLQAAAFAFDGLNTVTIRPDPTTIQKGTYVLSGTSDGKLNIHVTYADNTTQDFKITQLTATSLAIASSEPYVYYHDGVLMPTIAVTSTAMQRLNSSDINGQLVRVAVSHDSIYSVKVYLTHSGATKMVDSVSNISRPYVLAVPAQAGDRLKVDVLGNVLHTAINAYVDGLPITGDISASGQETVTTNGWVVTFPTNFP
ncbi:MAG TPA: hypothetical protein VL442_12385 [Mucilaginibacter sp.]|nr:hypothetical protein [Mucilaginibacter sp.]